MSEFQGPKNWFVPLIRSTSARTCIATLMGLPHVSISVVPLWNLPGLSLLNIMDMPLISTFIRKSINTALAEYVAPRSITLDLQQILAGDDVKKDTDMLGVIVVFIHRARKLSKMDWHGGSGTYTVVLTTNIIH